MELLKDIVLVLHFIGLAGILGGVLAQRSARSRRIDALVMHGASTQLVTGVLLVGLRQGMDLEVDNVKITVKLVILLIIWALAWRYRKARSVATSVWGAIGLLTVANIVVAVFWR